MILGEVSMVDMKAHSMEYGFNENPCFTSASDAAFADVPDRKSTERILYVLWLHLLEIGLLPIIDKFYVYLLWVLLYSSTNPPAHTSRYPECPRD